MNKDQKENLLVASVQSVYQCIFEIDISHKYNQTTIGLASMVFQIYMDEELNQKGLMNGMLHRVRTVFLPKNQRNSDVFVYEDMKELIGQMEGVQIDPNKAQKQEMEKTLNQKNFDRLIRDINSVLFYLSNVEVTRCQQQGEECCLTEPVEIILTIIDVFKFRDQFEREWNEQQ